MPFMQVEESNKHLRRGDFSTLNCLDGPSPKWMDRMIQMRKEEKWILASNTLCLQVKDKTQILSHLWLTTLFLKEKAVFLDEANLYLTFNKGEKSISVQINSNIVGFSEEM